LLSVVTSPEAPLAARLDTVLLHQSLHPLLTHPNTLRTQLPPDARPAVRPAILRVTALT